MGFFCVEIRYTTTYVEKNQTDVSKPGLNSFSVGISPVLPIPYRRKTQSVHFGIKKGVVAPFFLKRGAMAPFLRSPTPFWKKGGRKGGKYTKKGGMIPTKIPKIQQI